MTQLAQALGVKRPTLLYHFPTRGDVVVVALEDLLQEQAMFVLRRIAKHIHPIDRLYARLCAIHEFHKGQEQRMVFLSQAVVAIGEQRLAELIEVGNRVFAPYRQAQAEHVRRGIEEGTVHPCDVDALMALIRSIADGLLMQRVMTGVPFEPVHEFLWDRVLMPLKREEND